MDEQTDTERLAAHRASYECELGWARSYVRPEYRDPRSGQRMSLQDSCNRNRALQECYRQIAYIMSIDPEEGRRLLRELDTELCY